MFVGIGYVTPTVKSVPYCSAYNISQMQLTVFLCLCSRTTGGPTIRNAILGFLGAYPTPSAVLGASNKELEECIGPLGLQEVRRKALQQMSHDFFAKVSHVLGCPACLHHTHCACIKRSRCVIVLAVPEAVTMHCACRLLLTSFVSGLILDYSCMV